MIALRDGIVGWSPYGWPALTTAPAAPQVDASDVRSYENAVRELPEGACTALFGSYNFWLYDTDRRGPCGLVPAERSIQHYAPTFDHLTFTAARRPK